MNAVLENADTPVEISLATVVIPLLKGVVYQEHDGLVWDALLKLETRVRDYVRVLQLDLVMDEAEGYAFLRSVEPESDEDSVKARSQRIPRLYARRPLSFPVSLLLALLRRKLAEADTAGGESRVVVSLEDVTESLRIFLPTQANKARWTDQVESHLNRIVEMGFIRKLKTTAGSPAPVAYEIRRILKAFVDAQWLSEFDRRLEAYREHLESPTDNDESHES